jgi:membrane protein YdbS with pleckstrin-like domain
MKKLIRALFKLPLTPLVVLFLGLFLLACCVLYFFEWVYEASEHDMQITRGLLSDVTTNMKKWFTTI